MLFFFMVSNHFRNNISETMIFFLFCFYRKASKKKRLLAIDLNVDEKNSVLWVLISSQYIIYTQIKKNSSNLLIDSFDFSIQQRFGIVFVWRAKNVRAHSLTNFQLTLYKFSWPHTYYMLCSIQWLLFYYYRWEYVVPSLFLLTYYHQTRDTKSSQFPTEFEFWCVFQFQSIVLENSTSRHAFSLFVCVSFSIQLLL